MAIVIVAGRLFFGVGWPRDLLSLIVFVALGVACFAALGVALSHVIPNFESAPAYVNAVFLPTIVISGVVLRRRQRARRSCATSPRRCRSST